MSREEFDHVRAETETLKHELNSWQNTTISILKTYLLDQGTLPGPTHARTMHTHYYKKPLTTHIVLHTGVGQCPCTTDIKQLWEKMDRVQDSVAANNASSQGKLHVLTFCRRLSTLYK